MEDLEVQEYDVYYSILKHKNKEDIAIQVPKAIRLISQMNETLASVCLEEDQESSLMNNEAYDYLLDWYSVKATLIYQEHLCAVATIKSNDELCVEIVELDIL